MGARLNDRAVAAAAGLPAPSLASWLRRGHLMRPPLGWRLEDAVSLRVAWLLCTAAGMEPATALCLCDEHRHDIWRGAGWLVLTRRHEHNVIGGAVITGDALVLDRREDVVAVLTRAAAGGADLTEVLVIDLAEAQRKCEFALAGFMATRRARGRPRKNKESEA